MKNPSLLALALGFLLLSFSGYAESQNRRSVESLVKDLGHQSYRVRKKAHLRLLKRPEAIPLLTKALKSKDVEVKQRAQKILHSLNHHRCFSDRELAKLTAKALLKSKHIAKTAELHQQMQQRLTPKLRKTLKSVELAILETDRQWKNARSKAGLRISTLVRGFEDQWPPVLLNKKSKVATNPQILMKYYPIVNAIVDKRNKLVNQRIAIYKKLIEGIKGVTWDNQQTFVNRFSDAKGPVSNNVTSVLNRSVSANTLNFKYNGIPFAASFQETTYAFGNDFQSGSFSLEMSLVSGNDLSLKGAFPSQRKLNSGRTVGCLLPNGLPVTNIEKRFSGYVTYEGLLVYAQPQPRYTINSQNKGITGSLADATSLALLLSMNVAQPTANNRQWHERFSGERLENLLDGTHR